MPLRRGWGPRVALLSPLLASLVVRDARAADAPTSAQCESAYEATQLLRQRGRLLAARDQADLCARDACPDIGRADCARWSGELVHQIPSVVVVAREESGREIPGLRLLVDGTVRAELASGRAFELDPGAHAFRIERPDGPALEQSFTVFQGERDRMLRITLPVATSPHALSGRSAREVPPSATDVAPPGGSIVPAIVVGSVSVAVLAASAFLGLTGRQELSDLRSSCAPSCTDDQVNPVHTRLVASDVTLAVGLVGAALAVTFFALRASF